MEQMTEVQSKTIPLLLTKKDVLVKSQTGSGKTLAYAIPIVEVKIVEACFFSFNLSNAFTSEIAKHYT